MSKWPKEAHRALFRGDAPPTTGLGKHPPRIER